MVDKILNNINRIIEKGKEGLNRYLNLLYQGKETALENIFMKLDSTSVEKILLNLTITEIIWVLKGSSDDLRGFIISNIKGPTTRSLIIYELDHAVTEESEIAEAQGKMLKVIQKLRESGEIYTGIFGYL